MNPPAWILPEVVLALHDMLIAEFGGESGLRDESLLQSALARTQHLHTYESPSMPVLAASYAFGFIQNYPFLVGNKRIGFTVAALFLELNGRRFHAAEADAVIQTLALAAGALSEPEYAEWLTQNATPAQA
jgi:death-on-curing protein